MKNEIIFFISGCPQDVYLYAHWLKVLPWILHHDCAGIDILCSDVTLSRLLPAINYNGFAEVNKYI